MLTQCHFCGIKVERHISQIRLWTRHFCSTTHLSAWKKSQRMTKFWKRVKRIPSGCWIWTGCTVKGYGRVGIKENGIHFSVLAHRFSYEASVGQIPKGKQLLHH